MTGNPTRLSVRAMSDRRHVAVVAPVAAPRQRALGELRESLGAGLRRASALLPGTSVELARAETDPARRGDGTVLGLVHVGGSVCAPEPLAPRQMRAFARTVAQLLSADGFEISEPVLIEENAFEQ